MSLNADLRLVSKVTTARSTRAQLRDSTAILSPSRRDAIRGLIVSTTHMH